MLVCMGESGDIIFSSNSNSLTVRGYSGALALHNLGSKIEHVCIEDAPQILLTDLQKFSSLRVLDVSGDMFSEEVDDGVFVPSVQVCLQNVRPTGTLLSNVFKFLPALTEMKLIGSNGDHGEHVLQFPSSSRRSCSIKMESCDNLILGVEGGGDLTSLQSLKIEGCGEIFFLLPS
jgi:hypothetical protein